MTDESNDENFTEHDEPDPADPLSRHLSEVGADARKKDHEQQLEWLRQHRAEFEELRRALLRELGEEQLKGQSFRLTKWARGVAAQLVAPRRFDGHAQLDPGLVSYWLEGDKLMSATLTPDRLAIAGEVVDGRVPNPVALDYLPDQPTPN